MRFSFDEDQSAIRDGVRDYLRARAGTDLLGRAWTDPEAGPAWEVWSDLATMGVTGLLVPESAGGSGSGWVAAAAVLAECGRVALPLPVIETAAVAAPLLARAGDRVDNLAGVLDGTAVVSAATGPDDLFPFSGRADWFLVGGPECRVFRRGEVEIEPVPSVDRTRDTARVRPRAGGMVLDPGTALPVYQAGALASAAALVGLGRALVEMTVAYVQDRRQFGVAVGSFQAVKHRLADAALGVEFAAPAVWAAAWEAEQGSGSAPASISLAKALASDGAERAAAAALQCHGAMGYTDDYHLHFWLKRVWCLAASYGTSRQHRAGLADHLGITA